MSLASGIERVISKKRLEMKPDISNVRKSI